MSIQVIVGSEQHVVYAQAICDMINDASQKRGTGIAKRSPEYIAMKLADGKAIIALDKGEPAGFCYIETWSHAKYVANSGLIVGENYRHSGLAKKIKKAAFELSNKLYPESKLFGITTSLPVMKINSDLGYKPVTFSELTDDDAFWKGCESCKNHDILLRNEHKMCLCTAMLFTPEQKKKNTTKSKTERWDRFKRFIKLKRIRSQRLLKTVAFI